MSYWSGLTSQRTGRRRLLKSGAALSLGAAALSLLGCGSDEDDAGDTASQSSSGTPKRGGKVGTFTATVANYSVISNYGEGYRNSGQLAYDRLLSTRVDARRYVLEAAEKIEIVSPTQLVFTLKPDLVYQDIAPVSGRAVVADDIVQTQNFIKTLANAYNSSFQRTYMDRVEAPNNKTFVLHLKQPSAYIFSSPQLGNPTSWPIVPKETLSTLEGTPPIGSGPYQMTDNTLNVRYNYKRFEKFREAKQGKPYIDEREVVVLVDPIAQEAAMVSGQAHYWRDVPAASADRVLKDYVPDRLAAEEVLQSRYFSRRLNTNPQFNKIWRDERIRQAFYRLTNRAQILDLVFGGRGAVASSPLPASFDDFYRPDTKDTAPFYKEDAAEAKRLLDAASFPYGQEIELVISTTPTNGTAAEVWGQQLARAGVKIRPVAMPNAEWMGRFARGEFELTIAAGPAGDTPQQTMRMFHSDTLETLKHFGVYEPSIDALVEKSEITLDKDENAKLVRQIQLEGLKRYAAFDNWLTPTVLEVRSLKLKEWEHSVADTVLYQTQAWLDT